MIVHGNPLDVGGYPLFQDFRIIASLVGDDAQLGRIRLDALKSILSAGQLRSERLHLLLQLAVFRLQSFIFGKLPHNVHVIVDHEG